MRNGERYRELGHILTEDYFSGGLEFIRGGLEDYWGKNSSRGEAPAHSLRLFTKKRAGSAWSRVEPLLDACISLPVEHDKNTDRLLRNYVEREGLRRVATEISRSVDNGLSTGASEFAARLRELAGAHSRNDRGGSIRTGEVNFYQLVTTGRWPTGLPSIDYALYGGLGKGELGIILGKWGGGKTSFLVHLTVTAALAGARVLYITLEIPRWQVEMRCYQRAGGHSIESVVESSKVAKQARSLFEKAGGDVLVYDYSHEPFSPAGIEALFQRENPDIVMLDYGALCRSDRGFEGRRFELGYLFREFRRQASAFQVPFWVPHQTNRLGGRDEDFGGDDVGEDISISQTCDVMLAVGEHHIKIEKTRLPRSGARRRVRIKSDFDHQVFIELGEEVASGSTEAEPSGAKKAGKKNPAGTEAANAVSRRRGNPTGVRRKRSGKAGK